MALLENDFLAITVIAGFKMKKKTFLLIMYYFGVSCVYCICLSNLLKETVCLKIKVLQIGSSLPVGHFKMTDTESGNSRISTQNNTENWLMKKQ